MSGGGLRECLSHVVVAYVLEQLQLPVATLGMNDALERSRQLLHGHLLFIPRVLRGTVTTQEAWQGL